MGRPQIDDEVLDRLESTVDGRTKVPAEHLTTEERLAFLLDELDEADRRLDYLEDRVDHLETELESAREEDDPAIDDLGGIGGVNPGAGGRQF